jgi:GTP-binding protein
MSNTLNTKLAQVAIVGRANVGKSMLFNRLVGKSKALVSSISGTTRDRNIDMVTWGKANFQLIDTGGLDIDEKDITTIEQGIIDQAQGAIKKAQVILFVIDSKTGILPDDRAIAKSLIKAGLKAKILLVGNKADSLKWHQRAAEFYELGLGEPYMVSAANGSGTGDLLDVIIKKLPQKLLSYTAPEQPPIRLAIVGKPNVGKSSLVNAILGEERVIVSDIAHTTRESHDTAFTYKDQLFLLIDTAGIRKQARITPRTLEKKSVVKSMESIENADVVLLITEAQKKIDAQEKKITSMILEASRSVIIVANKWDLIPDKDTATINKYIQYYRAQFPYLWWAPLIFVSALDKQRTHKILDMVMDIEASKRINVTQGQLDHLLQSAIKKQPPSRGRGLKNPFIYKIEQASTNPPRFNVIVDNPIILHFSYIRFIQNTLRETFKILGTPIQIEVKKKKRPKTEKTPKQ